MRAHIAGREERTDSARSAETANLTYQCNASADLKQLGIKSNVTKPTTNRTNAHA